jgi:outer membrane lipoprotein carrier protein
VRVTLIGLVWLGALPGWLAPPAEPTAEELVRRIEASHRAAGDLTAHFIQSYRSGMLGQEIVESGRLALKRPGRMRWDYERPEKKTFVADGEAFYFYVPQDRQVIVRGQGGERGVALSLLDGSTPILEQFQAELEPALDGPARLRLTPRASDPDVERVWLEADDRGLIRSIEILDVQSNRSLFRFDELRTDRKLDDALFHFEIPPGVDVVRG